MQFWLMKSEPDEVSIDHLANLPAQTVPWFGVRNYQARNFMCDAMQIGDLAFFYHSGCAEPGIAGICEVCSEPYPDEIQFIAVSLAEMRAAPELANMRLLARGNRLSITPVSAEEWQFITQHLMGQQ